MRLVLEDELEEVRGGAYRHLFGRNNGLTLGEYLFLVVLEQECQAGRTDASSDDNHSLHFNFIELHPHDGLLATVHVHFLHHIHALEAGAEVIQCVFVQVDAFCRDRDDSVRESCQIGLHFSRLMLLFSLIKIILFYYS